MDTAWKAFERRIAKRYGVSRNVYHGTAVPDVIAEVAGHVLAIEVKLWAEIPKKMSSVLEQAERNAKEHETPISIVKLKGDLDENSIVMMRLKVFDEFLGIKKEDVDE